ncbi:MAG: hypothetical protein NTZ95_06745 [Candidatus Omnitrophica bacterium]|nr:hypothetical protein [Candidatus Omnitrophota bacterium]
MTRKARLWTGVTMIVLLLLNYATFAIPLAKRSSSIEERAMVMMREDFESGKALKGSENDYILQILKKEKAVIDGKLGMLNMAAASLAIVIASWTLFGMISNKGRSR